MEMAYSEQEQHPSDENKSALEEAGEPFEFAFLFATCVAPDRFRESGMLAGCRG
jgi:hypothetical protein